MTTSAMQGEPYQTVVGEILNNKRPQAILDAPSGNGWLRSRLEYTADVDGIDLFETKPNGYRTFKNADLDFGIPGELALYEAIVSCEGIEHIGNPDLFLKTVGNHLVDGGMVVITTPNIWYPGARLQFLLRGFFPSFPCLVGRIKRGTHMHIMPWSFPQLFLYLKLNGFSEISLHDVPEKKPKHFFERMLGIPQHLYCSSKLRRAVTEEERIFWRGASSKQSIYGRQLVVSATYRRRP